MGKPADATNNMMTGNNEQTPPAATPPAAAPAPAAPPAAPAEPVGVAATGRTLIMQNCIAAGCHGSTPLNAKDDAGLQAGMNIVAHSAALKAGNYFTKPAAGSAANNYSHVLAYLKANPTTPIMGPNIP
jgi:mono/diheme cytochrome c family protein